MMLLTCEYGERLTNQYEIFYDEFTQRDWCLFPLKVQQFLPIIISNIQRPVEVQGYAHTVYRREFCKMVNFCCVFIFVFRTVAVCENFLGLLPKLLHTFPLIVGRNVCTNPKVIKNIHGWINIRLRQKNRNYFSYIRILGTVLRNFVQGTTVLP